MKTTVDPRQLGFGFAADCTASQPPKIEWSRPQRPAPVLDRVLGAEIVVHDAHGYGRVCPIVARFGTPPVLVARWPNNGGLLEFDEKSGKLRRPKKRHGAWRIAPDDRAHLADNPATYDLRDEAERDTPGRRGR